MLDWLFINAEFENEFVTNVGKKNNIEMQKVI